MADEKEPILKDFKFEGQALNDSDGVVSSIVRAGKNKDGKVLKLDGKKKKK